MYYKVLKNNRVIDVLDNLIYLKWDSKHKIMVLTDINDAQAILSSGKDAVWHEESLYKVPVEGYETVRLEEISEFEFKQLRMLGLKSLSEILDEYTLLLISEGVI